MENTYASVLPSPILGAPHFEEKLNHQYWSHPPGCDIRSRPGENCSFQTALPIFWNSSLSMTIFNQFMILLIRSYIIQSSPSVCKHVHACPISTVQKSEPNALCQLAFIDDDNEGQNHSKQVYSFGSSTYSSREIICRTWLGYFFSLSRRLVRSSFGQADCSTPRVG